MKFHPIGIRIAVPEQKYRETLNKGGNGRVVYIPLQCLKCKELCYSVSLTDFFNYGAMICKCTSHKRMHYFRSVKNSTWNPAEEMPGDLSSRKESVLVDPDLPDILKERPEAQQRKQTWKKINLNGAHYAHSYNVLQAIFRKEREVELAHNESEYLAVLRRSPQGANSPATLRCLRCRSEYGPVAIVKFMTKGNFHCACCEPPKPSAKGGDILTGNRKGVRSIARLPSKPAKDGDDSEGSESDNSGVANEWIVKGGKVSPDLRRLMATAEFVDIQTAIAERVLKMNAKTGKKLSPRSWIYRYEEVNLRMKMLGLTMTVNPKAYNTQLKEFKNIGGSCPRIFRCDTCKTFAHKFNVSHLFYQGLFKCECSAATRRKVLEAKMKIVKKMPLARQVKKQAASSNETSSKRTKQTKQTPVKRKREPPSPESQSEEDSEEGSESESESDDSEAEEENAKTTASPNSKGQAKKAIPVQRRTSLFGAAPVAKGDIPATDKKMGFKWRKETATVRGGWVPVPPRNPARFCDRHADIGILTKKNNITLRNVRTEAEFRKAHTVCMAANKNMSDFKLELQCNFCKEITFVALRKFLGHLTIKPGGSALCSCSGLEGRTLRRRREAELEKQRIKQEKQPQTVTTSAASRGSKTPAKPTRATSQSSRRRSSSSVPPKRKRTR
jgi:hypothetical protein